MARGQRGTGEGSPPAKWAREMGFKNRHEELTWMAHQHGFKSRTEYQKFRAEVGELPSHTEIVRRPVGGRFVSVRVERHPREQLSAWRRAIIKQGGASSEIRGDNVALFMGFDLANELADYYEMENAVPFGFGGS